ncbi:MAG: DUF1850 domain-containing protein [Burkholderiales bacterium]
MSSLCLTAGALAANLFAQALHLEWTTADGVRREESWHVAGSRLELVAARIAPRDASTKPPEGAVLADGKFHHWPRRPAESRLVLRREGLANDYVLCGEGWCTPLERLLPRARAPVVEIAPCPR